MYGPRFAGRVFCRGFTMPKISFEQWMKSVDAWCIAKCGMSVHDLPDCCYADWHADGMTAKQAATKAIKAAKSEGY